MAIYYMNVQIIGRSAGRSATGAAAYRAGERIVDERTGQIYDYTRRRGEIETEIHAPEGAPDWARDRSILWNAAEKAERRADAQVAREIVVALPKELNDEQQRELIRSYVQEQFVSRGMVADVAIHRNQGNPHAHIMLSMREMGPDGFSAKKNREWNMPEMLGQWREDWAVQSNRALERAGREERIDHRSLAEQGLERLPQVHLGPHAAALEKQGIPTEKGEHNRAVVEHNAVVVDLAKAREERQALAREKAAQERTATRVKSGWQPDHAQALERLEVQRRRELKVEELKEQRSAVGADLQKVRGEIADIMRDGQQLDLAREALERHRVAQERLRPHETLVGKAKRLFSPEARVAYKDAQARVQITQGAVDRWGVKNAGELAKRLDAWEQRRANLPGLESKAGELQGALGLIDKALEGFSRAVERARREREREAPERGEILRRLQQNIERSRDSGRGR